MGVYQSKTWQDMICSYPNRYKIKHSDLSEEQVTMINDFEDEGDQPQQSGDVFDASTMNNFEARVNAGILSCVDTLSGTSNPTGSQGKNGDTFFKYETDGNTTTIVGMFVKLNGAWLEVSVGGAQLPQAEGGGF